MILKNILDVLKERTHWNEINELINVTLSVIIAASSSKLIFAPASGFFCFINERDCFILEHNVIELNTKAIATMVHIPISRERRLFECNRGLKYVWGSQYLH